jgi:hypothetical protein
MFSAVCSAPTRRKQGTDPSPSDIRRPGRAIGGDRRAIPSNSLKSGFARLTGGEIRKPKGSKARLVRTDWRKTPSPSRRHGFARRL